MERKRFTCRFRRRSNGNCETIMQRPLIVIGTRPEAIKLAPVVWACRRRDDVEPLVCLTGQHRELIEPALDYFGIDHDANLELMDAESSLADLTAGCLQGVEAVIEELKPDGVVVQGDTTTALAAALAGFYRRLPVAHVEAGLRTGDLAAPWPEEMNRRTITLAASLHFAPTPRARQHLIDEGVRAEAIHVTGNTAIDALLWTLDRERRRDAHWRARHGALADRDVVLVTVHRRENHGPRLDAILDAVRTLADAYPETAFVFPVHLNPRVRSRVRTGLDGLANMHLTDPLAYPEFVWMMDRCRLILSDSGGIQEEAPTLGKPVLVLRDTTERPEAIECGAATLAGSDPIRIVELAEGELNKPRRTTANSGGFPNPFGDGNSSERIVQALRQA